MDKKMPLAERHRRTQKAIDNLHVPVMLLAGLMEKFEDNSFQYAVCLTTALLYKVGRSLKSN